MKALQISASQIETWQRCPRLWWFQWVKKIRSPKKPALLYGTALHSVAERYLEADELGRGPDGNPVDLYPEGWHVVEEREIRYELNNLEQAQIQKTIAEAIKAGVLERGPHQHIERRFEWKICKGVTAVGYIDVDEPARVQDHKTTGSMRYAKSPAKLAKATQMHVYAAAKQDERRVRGEPPLPEIAVRHNYFCKDPSDPRVRAVNATITKQDSEKFTDELREEIVPQMLRDRDVEAWHKFADPGPGACMAYGGCPMQPVCTGREDLDRFKVRMEAVLTNLKDGVNSTHELTTGNNRKRSKMGFEEQLAKLNSAKKADVPPAVVDAKIVPDVEPEPAEAVKPPASDEGASAPPWTVEGCKPCSASPGWNSKGEPCGACLTRGKIQKLGLPTPSEFVIEAMDGSIMWTHKLTGEAGYSTLTSAKASSEKREEPVAKKPKPKAEETEAPPPAEAKEEAPVAKTRGRGRPAKGIRLLVGCMPSSGTAMRNVLMIEKVLKDYGEELAKSQGQESYWALDAFKRRDALAQVAPSIAAGLGNTVLVSPRNPPPDIASLLSALAPLADEVYTAV